MTRALGLGLAVLLTVVACGQGGGTVDGAAEARDRYLAIVDEVAEIWDTAEASGSLEALRSAAEQRAEAARTMSLALRTEAWPREVQGAVEDVVVHMDAEVRANERAARANDLEAFWSAIDGIPASDASQRVRAQLGLPDVPD